MGYLMHQRDDDFLVTDELGAACALVEASYDYSSLRDGFDHQGWVWTPRGDGMPDELIFQGYKLWEQEEFLTVIAPFVLSGSYIEMQGEDGASWRWVVRNGVLQTDYPIITWA